MKKSFWAILLFFVCIASSLAFAQESSVEEEIHQNDLALRMQIRSDIFRKIEEVGPQFFESSGDPAIDLETLTKKILSLELKDQPISKEETQQFNLLWKTLRNMKYWQTLSSILEYSKFRSQKLYGRYTHTAKMRGIGYSTYYISCKIAGIFVGLYFFAQKDLATLALLNSFSWNTAISILLDLPARILRSIKLRWNSGGIFAHRRIKNYIKSIQKNYDLQERLSDGIPYAILEEENGDLPRMLARIPLFKRKAEKFEKEIRDFSNDFPHDEKLSTILNNKLISRPTRLALAWVHMSERFPEEARRLENDFGLRPNHALQSTPELNEFARKITNCNNMAQLEELFHSFPDNLGPLQRIDIWLTVVLPYLARHKKTEFSFIKFRMHYLRAELLFAKAIRSFNKGMNFDWMEASSRIFKKTDDPASSTTKCKVRLQH